MAEEKKTYEVTPEEKQFQEEIGKEIEEKIKQGKMVWQTDRADRKTIHTPIYAANKQDARSATALLMMQKQFELDTFENRWVTDRTLAKKTFKVKENEKPLMIISNHEKIAVYNYSQLEGVPKQTEKDRPSREVNRHAELMIDRIKYLTEKETKPLNVTKDNFFTVAYHAYKRATEKSKEMEDYIAKENEKDKQCLEDFKSRLDVVKNTDLSKTPKGIEAKFVHDMAQAYQENPERKNYVFKAAAKALLGKAKEEKVKEMIIKYAPEAAKDPIKQRKNKDMNPYSDFVVETLKKDDKFQKAYKEMTQKKTRATKKEKEAPAR